MSDVSAFTSATKQMSLSHVAEARIIQLDTVGLSLLLAQSIGQAAIVAIAVDFVSSGHILSLPSAVEAAFEAAV